MELSPERKQLRDRFFTALLETAMPLKAGPDAEVTLETIIEAVDQLLKQKEKDILSV